MYATRSKSEVLIGRYKCPNFFFFWSRSTTFELDLDLKATPMARMWLINPSRGRSIYNDVTVRVASLLSASDYIHHACHPSESGGLMHSPTARRDEFDDYYAKKSSIYAHVIHPALRGIPRLDQTCGSLYVEMGSTTCNRPWRGDSLIPRHQ